MVIGAIVIWLLIGGVFGFFRARAKYHDEIERYAVLIAGQPIAIKRDALIEAGVTWVLWMALGLFAAIAFVIWIAARAYLKEKKIM